ncbi:hypothetical protein M9Y10_001508 [Tritrichomonas musculus]|uniref:Protein kinase domain-containing protein n=1 Tax=Tritrichomonas musculus TaxID=1915356 RepID=A0ABR2L767_9EUKA
MYINLDNSFFDNKEYKLGEKIGSGGFANVYIAERIQDGALFAAKIFRKESSTQEQNMFLRSSLISKNLNHPCISKCYGISFCGIKHPTQYRPTILMEYFPKGTLMDIIDNEKRSSAPIDWSPTKKIINLIGIAHAMKYLHSQGVIHRDLKSKTVLLDDNLYPHLGGFTFLRNFPRPLTLTNELDMSAGIGTPLYMAPELIKMEDNYGIGVDIYAFAIIAYEVASGLDVNNGRTTPYIHYKNVIQGIRPDFPDDMTKPMKDLISKCWNEDVDERLPFDVIYEKLTSDYKSYTQYDVDEDEVREYIDMLNDS